MKAKFQMSYDNASEALGLLVPLLLDKNIGYEVKVEGKNSNVIVTLNSREPIRIEDFDCFLEETDRAVVEDCYHTEDMEESSYREYYGKEISYEHYETRSDDTEGFPLVYTKGCKDFFTSCTEDSALWEKSKEKLIDVSLYLPLNGIELRVAKLIDVLIRLHGRGDGFAFSFENPSNIATGDALVLHFPYAMTDDWQTLSRLSDSTLVYTEDLSSRGYWDEMDDVDYIVKAYVGGKLVYERKRDKHSGSTFDYPEIRYIDRVYQSEEITQRLNPPEPDCLF